MAVELNSLPRMICLEDYGGNYAAFINAVYQIFFRDFIRHKAMFGSHRIHLRYHPAFQDRPYAFYNMTHKGDIENERLPDLRRCDRIPWARPTIEQTESGWKLITVTITLLSCTSTGIMSVFLRRFTATLPIMPKKGRRNTTSGKQMWVAISRRMNW